MKTTIIILAIWLISLPALSQEESPSHPGTVVEQQLENLAEQTETETEDDSYLQSLMGFRQNKLNLNTATASELRELKLLTDLQIQNLLRYRQLLGSLISIYELQAVPTWDLETIQRLIHYIRIGSAVPLTVDLKDRLVNGRHSVLIRAQQVLEGSAGFLRPDSVVNRYAGSRQRVFFRYKYVYRNLLQYGLVGDKDAGEQFFRGKQTAGFDFYSFHLFARKIGIIKSLALGDFSVNMGQGLIQWQSLAFKKSADITNIKRQADILRPYNSPTEYNFQRGAGITLKINRFELTAFASSRKVDANFQSDTSSSNDDFASSILTSGYHRTPSELEKRSTLQQTGYGGNISYNTVGFHLGVNALSYHFSAPLQRNIQPYNQYAIQGKNWHNYSIDYSYTYKNMHFFGEAAFDKDQSRAFMSGLVLSLDAKVDASLVYRNIEKTYQSLYGNAFTEGTFPTNEKGLYTGLSIKPLPTLRLDTYADVYSFPWLRYRVDAPTRGADYFVQLTYKPNTQVEVYTRYKNESKGINLSGGRLPTREVVNRPRQNWRTHISYKVNRDLTLRSRVELMWFDAKVTERKEKGFMTYYDAVYKPFGKPVAAGVRFAYFETDSYDSRIYAFENDVLYSFSIPAFFNKGFRYYLNINYDVSKKMTIWARYARTIKTNKTEIGSGLDRIPGKKRSEMKLQVMYNF